MAFGLSFGRVPSGRHSFQVGRHRKRGKPGFVAGKHRVSGPWDTNFFSGKHKPRHGRKVLGIF